MTKSKDYKPDTRRVVGGVWRVLRHQPELVGWTELRPAMCPSWIELKRGWRVRSWRRGRQIVSSVRSPVKILDTHGQERGSTTMETTWYSATLRQRGGRP